MTRYRINPYISFIENRLFPEIIQQAVFHRLSNEIIEPSEATRSLLQIANRGALISLAEDDFEKLGQSGGELKQLIDREFLIPEDYDPLTHFTPQLVTRPIQNPAVVYRSKTGEWILLRTSMEHTIYSRKPNELPLVIEEKMPALASEIFLLADGSKTLQQVFRSARHEDKADLLHDSEFRAAIDFLSSQERQLIKFTSQAHDLDQPFMPVNIVPRNLYHSDRWNEPLSPNPDKTIIDFHLQGIEDAGWEFDLIEPTINHGFRFPHDALGGLDYGSRFCVSTLRSAVVPMLDHTSELEVLEVGGGTGSFARSFIQQASKLEGINARYHVLELSPTLMSNQKKVLGTLLPESRHFHQDATEFELADRSFDLIISNEVIADFPVASVERNTASDNGQVWQGDGAHYVEKYGLSDTNAPDSFLVNVGAFRFLERAWKHLKPGGTLIVSEYGSVQHYPARSFHLNHDEYTIHFGHLYTCATSIGFECKLMTLRDFLGFDDDVLVLDGREEHILCLNHVLRNYGVTLPYAVIAKSEFERECLAIAEQIELTGYSFSPLKNGFYFGPNINDFLVLIMDKPGNDSTR